MSEELQNKRFAVIGHPIAHSLSPAMHNAAFAECQLPYTYQALDIHPDRLAESLASMYEEGFCGFNVTIPHKEAVFKSVQDVSQDARRIGAVNTVVRTDQGWQGNNTDADGFMKPLLERGDVAGMNVVVLGAGGAARAVVFALAKYSVKSITIVARTVARAEAIAQDLHAVYPTLICQCADVSQELIQEAQLIVNTTPLGMKADDAQLFPYEWIPVAAVCYDLIYWPECTPFLQQAKRKGCVIINGLDMLLWQGVLAWELWTQRTAPVDVMRQALQQALQERHA